ncbi:unnamed protein product [Prorocentrum cordatum]|uniref:Protein xylosyltransferase n=1 Tax=Prorocentrum cordatum TaxID=2364126 RepID=A0ABN9PT17_9DINO|nr:unnamed protein product [Polarella glacialis]
MLQHRRRAAMIAAAGVLLLVLGLPRACCLAPACESDSGQCDSQLIQTKAQAEQQVRFSGRRSLAPQECFSKFTGSSTYTVVLVFSGRRSLMPLLLRYLDRMVQQCSVHEVHLWDYTDYRGMSGDDDHDWLRDASEKRNGTEFQIMTHGFELHAWADVYEFYSSEKLGFERPRWSPRSELATRGNTVLVKADDDIVYIDTSRFDSYVEYIRTHREKFIVHANIVNNAVAAYYQANHIEELKKQIPELGEYPREGGNGHLGLFGPLLDQFLRCAMGRVGQCASIVSGPRRGRDRHHNPRLRRRSRPVHIHCPQCLPLRLHEAGYAQRHLHCLRASLGSVRGLAGR